MNDRRAAEPRTDGEAPLQPEDVAGPPAAAEGSAEAFPEALIPVHASAGGHREWWRDAVIYQIYPRSFADGDGDGVGDLPGITSRLGHLVQLGVDALWVCPFYPSPMADGGYDVADYTAVDPVFGTLADFDALLERAHALGLRVLIDVVPNHTSDEHPWFQAALAAPPGSRERQWYLFRTGRGPRGGAPPNDWQSIFGGPAWSRVSDLTGRPEDAGEWYLHTFDARQPDLNWDLPEVLAAFECILRFWLDRGVDGFRVDAAHGLVKRRDLPDWSGPAAMVMGASTRRMRLTADSAVDLGPMFDQERVHDVYRAWNRILAGYGGDRILVAEAPVQPVERVARYVRPDEMQQAFNFFYLQAPWDPEALREVITGSLRANDAVGATTTWVMSNHDTVRHASLLGLPDTGTFPNGIGIGDEQPDVELGLRRARAAALLTLALPGSAYLYQGEELGLPEHTTLDDEVRQDPAWKRSGYAHRGRDGCRVPLPWQADAPGFGFGSTGRPWLPQPAGWVRYAVDAQASASGSTLALYRQALRIRREQRLGSGSLAWVAGLAGPRHRHLAFLNGELLVVVNFDPAPLPLPPGSSVLMSSEEPDRGYGPPALPADTAVWARVTPRDAARGRTPTG